MARLLWRLGVAIGAIAVIAGPATAQPPTYNVGPDIVTETDPGAYDAAAGHYVESNGVRLGLSKDGGGYVSFVDTPFWAPGPTIPNQDQNENGSGYGRGWQMSIRDMLHSGRYNPTQAGFLDAYGAPVTLVKSASPHGAGGRVTIKWFEMPLYGDGINDFLENETFGIFGIQDQYTDDGQSSDDDGISEIGQTFDDELRSEFDFWGVVEDYSGQLGIQSNAAVFRFAHSLIFQRDPSTGPMQQFGPAAVNRDGDPVYNTVRALSDISPDISGAQAPTQFDLSGIYYSAFNLRMRREIGLDTFMWVDASGNWRDAPMSNVNNRVRLFGDRYEDLFTGALGLDSAVDPDDDLKLVGRAAGDFAVIADSDNPATANAIGVYVPQDKPENLNQVVTRDIADRSIISVSDRRMRSFLYAGDRGGASLVPGKPVNGEFAIPKAISVIGYRTLLTGLNRPESVSPGTVEGLRMNAFVIIGTPNEIRAVVEDLETNWAPVNLATDFEYNFKSDDGLWTGAGDVTAVATAAGSITGTVTGPDPRLLSPGGEETDLDLNQYVTIWLRNDTSATKAQLFFKTETSQSFSSDKRFDFPVKANDPVGRVYHLNMGSNANWTGTLTGLRIDPAQGASSGSFEIDYVKVHTEAQPTPHLEWIDDADSSITYSGSWSAANGNPEDHERTVHWSQTADDAFEYDFYGQGITIVGRYGPDQGIGRVLIDGVEVGTFDAYKSKTDEQEALFVVQGLSDAAHTLRVEVTGSRNSSSSGALITIDRLNAPYILQRFDVSQ